MKLGGWTAGSERNAQEAAATVERMRPIMRELAGFVGGGGGGAKSAEDTARPAGSGTRRRSSAFASGSAT